MEMECNFYDRFQLVPDSLMVKIFAYVSSQRFLNLFTLKLVCRRWYSLIMDSSLWRKIRLSKCENLDLSVLEQTLNFSSCVQEVLVDRCPLIDDICLALIAEKCPLLSVLNIKGCRKVSDGGVAEIAEKCVKLKRVSLSFYGSNITCTSLNKIVENCSELYELEIFHEEDEEYEEGFCISRQLLKSLGESLSLKVFTCESAVISEQILPRTDWRFDLLELNLPNCSDLTNGLLNQITSSCTSLKYLDVSNCPGINDSGLTLVSHMCPGLLHLNVKSCQCVTDIAIENIAENCKDLQFLCVAGCELPRPTGNVTDVAIKCIANNCHELAHLNVKWCQSVTDIGIAAVATKCNKLSSLNVSGCLAISDVSMKVVAACCKNLKSLDVAECLRITRTGINDIAQNCTDLSKLDMPVCSYVTNLDFKPITEGFLSLTHIDLSYCTKISDGCLKHVVPFCPQLLYLSLAGCHRITDVGVKYLATNCHELQYLDLSFRGSHSSAQITDDSFNLIAANCKNLTYLDLIGCFKISMDCIENIVKCCRYVKLMNISQVTDDPAVRLAVQSTLGTYRSFCHVDQVMSSTRGRKTAQNLIIKLSAPTL